MIKKLLIILGLATATGSGFTFDDNISSMAWTNLLKGYNAVYNEFSGAYNIRSKKWDVDNKAHVLSQLTAGKNTVVPQLVGVKDDDLIPEFRLTFILQKNYIMSANKLIFSTGSQRAEFDRGFYQYWMGNYEAGMGVSLPVFLSEPNKLKSILSPTDSYLKVRLSYSESGFLIYEFNKSEREAVIDLLNLYEKLVDFNKKRRGY